MDEGSGQPTDPQPTSTFTQLYNKETNHYETVYKEWEDRMERAATTASSLDAEQDSGNINRTQSMATLNESFPQGTNSGSGPRLEKIVKSSKARRRAKIIVSDDDKDSEDSSKQGRMIDNINQDVGITLVTPTKTSTQEDHLEDQLGILSAAKVLTDVARVHTYSRRRRTVSTGSGEVSTASRIISTAKETISTAGALMPVSTAGLVQENTSSSRASKDKGKVVITESDPEQTASKLKERQERAGYEAAIKLQ
ncbi:hypothetical protein Tco_1091166 [Tanacetum coccineum]|uniref:Uncharacterized protein n=1 Tax=Tanacetum coccineum TaxID=301880 RepID=A0ABQ5I8E7_9ASTR